MNRRQATTATAAATTGAFAACASNPMPEDRDALIAEAFTYAFPLYEMARTRWNALENPANPARGVVNTLGHRRQLSDHRNRAVTTPNNDTLYSSAWLDLAAGPVVVNVAAMPAGRYWSVALLDAFTNNAAMLGSRLDGVGPVRAVLVGPRWQGAVPEGRVIRLPGEDVWMLARWHAGNAAELPAARAMQDGLRLEAPTAPLPAAQRPRPASSLDAATFLQVANAQLARNPAPAVDAAHLRRYASVGLQPGAADSLAGNESLRQAWQQQLPALHASLQGGLGLGARLVQGWSLPAAAIGNFGNHHRLRAAVALGGLAALEPAEAVYLSREQDDAGAPLVGTQRYRIRVPPGGLPNDAFWSLSVYERLPDGRLFFTENPIERFAVNDRSAGLARNADGSLDLWLQRSAPADARDAANWLPAPPGPVQLTLRAYLPRPELREGRAPLPTVTHLA